MSSERHLPPIRVRDDPGAENPPRSAPYREPVELACFSKSRDAGVTYDSSMLKAYARPSVPFDLSEGFDTFRDRDRDVPRPADLAPIFGALRFKGAEDKELAAAEAADATPPIVWGRHADGLAVSDGGCTVRKATVSGWALTEQAFQRGKRLGERSLGQVGFL